jgi:putative nucleotidyltransferase with HDIG domain
VVFQDVQNDPRFAARRAEALQRGYAAMIGLPLKNTNGGTPLGALAICASEPRAFDDDEIRLLQELADDLAFGIQTLRTRDERERLQAEQRDGSRRLQRALLQTIQAVSLTVEKRDPYTAGHQQRVADVAVAIAGELGLPPERIEGIRLGAMIHDIGKIYAPAEILNRPGQLSAVEFEMIKTHSRVGYDIMKGVEFPWPVAEMILQHHERYDGSGYPRGLRGEEIMLEARILAVADVIESMYSHRPYRPALGLNAALDEITQNRGNFYDPAVVDACLKLHREGRLPLSLLTRR